MNLYPWPLIGGLLLSASAMPLLIWLARRLGIVDSPTHRKIHSAPTPYLGGLGIILGFTLIPALYLYLFKEKAAAGDGLRLVAILLPALAAALLGLADDRRPVRARVKLLAQIAIAFIFVLYCFRIEVIKVPGLGRYELYNWESIPFTMAWILGVVNGLNLIDGVDGLAGSVSATIFGAIAILASTLQQPDYVVAVVALAAMGATLGFLLFNWRPARIYMGDTGSLANGMLIATLLLAMGQRLGNLSATDSEEGIVEPYAYQFAKITLLAFYPLMEITLTILRRFLSGKPVGSADKGHVHHRLLRWGWTAPMVCAAAILLSAFAASTVIAEQLRYKGVASCLLISGSAAVVLVLHCCGYLEMLHPRSIRGSRPHFLIANHFISMQRIKLGLAHTIGEIAALTEQTCIEFGITKYAIRLVPQDPLGTPFEFDWNRPATAHGSILLAAGIPVQSKTLVSFSDRVALPSGTHAEWTFEPHVEEEELDVEYRVLMSDYMRKAIGCAEYVYRQLPGENSAQSGQNESLSSVRSSELRRRKTTSDKLSASQLDPSAREASSSATTGKIKIIL